VTLASELHTRATEHFARCEAELVRAQENYRIAREVHDVTDPERLLAWSALQTALAARDNAEAELSGLEAAQ
jgi:hypothetical protein